MKFNFKNYEKNGFVQESKFLPNDLLEFFYKKIKGASLGLDSEKLDYSYHNLKDNDYSLNQKFNNSEIYKNNLRKISRLQTDIEIKNKFINLIVNKFSLDSENKVLIHRCTAFRKPPNSMKSLSFHQDVGIDWRSTKEKNLFVLWIPFVSCNKNNGTLIVFPRSHKEGIIGDGTHLEIDKLDSLKLSLKRKYIYANPGDVVIFNPLLIHGSGPNLSSNERWAINMMFSFRDN